ncbi:hypothetical protein [Corynebacterium sp. HMSC076D02]|uniref:hypothetical protein n=1 Tax=Corynebacterium sp. HMSC076D02 TaxID=1739439 RepID=UPI0008A2C732|nr:hypothetical protein [Corynebacterium sp. HMSC076D02]OFQ45650.1 hypothetical protein HMPREF2935_05785 [Corynebacterium sp. HMSC076D02]
MDKKVLTALAAATAYFVAVPAASALLPEPTTPTSAVAFHDVAITDLECAQSPTYLNDSPRWECGDTIIGADPGQTFGEPETALLRKHRYILDTPFLSDAPVRQPQKNLYRLDEGDKVTILYDSDDKKLFFHLEGPDAARYADKMEVK